MSKKETKEYRLVWSKDGKVMRHASKKNLTHARDDAKKFLDDLHVGKLSPFWGTYKLSIEMRVLSPWQEIPLEEVNDD